jgi:hypothetical protein
LYLNLTGIAEKQPTVLTVGKRFHPDPITVSTVSQTSPPTPEGGENAVYNNLMLVRISMF